MLHRESESDLSHTAKSPSANFMNSSFFRGACLRPPLYIAQNACCANVISIYINFFSTFSIFYDQQHATTFFVRARSTTENYHRKMRKRSTRKQIQKSPNGKELFMKGFLLLVFMRDNGRERGQRWLYYPKVEVHNGFGEQFSWFSIIMSERLAKLYATEDSELQQAECYWNGNWLRVITEIFMSNKAPCSAIEILNTDITFMSVQKFHQLQIEM